MWVKDVRNYTVEIVEDGKVVYSGEVNDAPKELRERESKKMTIGNHKIIIEI